MHAAANMPPGQGKYRMVFREPDNTIRLLRPSDHVDPRRNGKQWPLLEDIPQQYHELVSWAKERYATQRERQEPWLGGLMRLRCLGKEIWEGIDADAYVRELREGWD
jgi:hypothetical protein